jgi:hypothetical protein
MLAPIPASRAEKWSSNGGGFGRILTVRAGAAEARRDLTSTSHAKYSAVNRINRSLDVVGVSLADWFSGHHPDSLWVQCGCRKNCDWKMEKAYHRYNAKPLFYMPRPERFELPTR